MFSGLLAALEAPRGRKHLECWWSAPVGHLNSCREPAWKAWISGVINEQCWILAVSIRDDVTVCIDTTSLTSVTEHNRWLTSGGIPEKHFSTEGYEVLALSTNTQWWWGLMVILFCFGAISSGRVPTLERFYKIFEKIWEKNHLLAVLHGSLHILLSSCFVFVCFETLRETLIIA